MGKYPRYNYNTDMKLRKAMECIRKGGSLSQAYRISGITPNTLKKYYDKYIAEYGITPSPVNFEASPTPALDPYGVFTGEQEITLKEYFHNFHNLFYGLTEKECRILAYQMAVINDVKMPSDWQYGMAASGWIANYKLRHPDLNIEKPERCSYKKNSSIVSEKKNVDSFYDNLERLLQTTKLIDSTRIFSLDETYTSPYATIKEGKDSKGDVITTCCIIGTSGTPLPPVIIQPHNMYTSSAQETKTLSATHGRLTPDLFSEVMQHFVTHSNSSRDNPSILIMDIALWHLSIGALSLAKAHGVYLVTLHPHVSIILQPLQLGIFDLFQTHYYECLEKSCENKDEKKLIDISEIVGEAIEKAMTSDSIKSAFKKCGVVPFDRDLLTDNDYQLCVHLDPCADCKSRVHINKLPNTQDPDTTDVIEEGSCEVSYDDQEEESGNSAGCENSSQTRSMNQTARNNRSDMSKDKKGAELDKLKRRMIRTVSRLLKEKKSEDEVWNELKKEGGGNCRQLWERMRSLTMKKLKRLFDAGDRVDLVPTVARMNLTDWLLYDLVIVHEKIDVIDRNQSLDSKVLSNLFSLVQMFSIEGRSGDDLAEAWTAATVHYNSKGHQCSPMLMQRRWFQIKELTRHKMYKFWFNYRGNQRLLPQANQDPPSELQKAIALRYPELITHQFPDWQERIERRLVIMPEEFEVKMRKKVLMRPSDESAPDVVIVEQKVDTITLGDSDSEYSDDDNSRGSNVTTPNWNMNTNNDDTSQTPIIIQVKSEPQDINENMDQTDYYYEEEPIDRFQDEIERLKLVEEKILSDEDTSRDVETRPSENQNPDVNVMPVITNVAGSVDTVKGNTTEPEKPTNNDTSQEAKENARQLEEETNINDISNVDHQLKTTESNSYVNSQELILIDDDDDDEENIPLKDLSLAQKNTNEAPNQYENAVLDITSPDSKVKTKDYVNKNGGLITEEIYVPVSNVENIHIDELTTYDEHAINDEVFPVITAIASGPQVAAKLEFIPEIPVDNLEEYMDDIVSFVPSDSSKTGIDIDMPLAKEKLELIDLRDSSDNPGEENMPNAELVQNKKESHDLDLADEILSNMNFADDGIEFADDGIEIDENELVDTSNHQKTEACEEQEVPPKFDLKLLMNPVVFTTKLDQMTVYKNRLILDTINEKELLDKIDIESKPTSVKSVNCALPEPKPVNLVHDVNIQYLEPNEHGSNEHQVEENNELNKNLDANENDDYEADDDLFHNDSSDESDHIQENWKVKLCSILLQKPKSRSYNPIQLCKNPDFNTRLKRLTVGFFTSARNRALLSACKPMTIDLSKSFESKLIHGTMYLKLSDQDVKVEKDENVTESTVSVIPSANPVQSLMDTKDVDRILEEELKKRMLERNKTINLPNISVVRQINQHLLMAEVAPIMAQVNRPSPTAPSANANNVTQNITTVVDDEVQSLKINLNVDITTHSNDSKCDNSLLTPRDTCSDVTYTNSNEIEKPKDLANLTENESEAEKIRLKKLERRRKLEREKHSAGWITKKYYDVKNDSDTLLTIDTLYKMLNALDPCQEYASKFNAYKPKSKRKIPVTDKPQTQREPPKSKPKSINVSALTSAVSTPKRQRVLSKSCCFARSKIEKLSSPTPGLIRLKRHTCAVGNCVCCCNHALRSLESHFRHDQTSNAVNTLTGTIEMDQSEYVSNISQPAVHIVNVNPNEVSTHSHPKMRIDVGSQADIVYENETLHVTVNPNDDTTHIEPDIPASVNFSDKNVTIDLDEEDDDESSKIKSPKPKIRVHSGNYTVVPKDPSRAMSHHNLRSKAVINKPDNLDSRSRKIAPNCRTVLPVTQVTAGPNRMQCGPVNQTPQQTISPNKPTDDLPCSCRPKVAVYQSSATLVVDGSSPCLRHANSYVSKETRIYLNRKHMSVTERPFYVGKNKILLTNVKQPKLAPSDPATMTFPEGVQVVMLPDGTITYLADPNIELTPEQIAAMPVILQAVQSQINAVGITLPEYSPSKQQSDINTTTINLDDDDAIQNLNDSANPEKNNVDSEPSIHQKRSNVNEEVHTSLPRSTHNVNESSNSENYFIRESDLQNNIENESTNNSQETSSAVSVDSIQKLNEYGITIAITMGESELQNKSCSLVVMDQSDLQNKVNEEVEPNEANVISESVTNITSEVKVKSDLHNKDVQEPSSNETNTVLESVTNTSSAVLNQSDSQNRDNQESTSNEMNTVSESVTHTSSDVLNQSDSQNKDNQKPTSSETNTVSESITNTSSDVMDQSEQESSTNKTNTKAIMNANDEENNVLLTEEALAKNIEASAKDTTELENPICPTASNQNVKNTAENLNKTVTEASDNTSISKRRNLFSDLMEMSGIGEEDMVPALQDLTQPDSSAKNTPQVEMQPLTLPIDTEISLQQPDFAVPALSPIGQKKHSISARIDEKVHELNPITSFAELKYACDNSGLFFKLDLNTGIIVPINVCIQKSPQVANKLNTSSTEVIDLTDEQGVSLNKETQARTASISPNINANAKQRTTKFMAKKLSTLMPVATPQNAETITTTTTIMPVQSKPTKEKMLSLSNMEPVKLQPRMEKLPAKLSKMKPVQLRRRVKITRPNSLKMVSILPENIDVSNTNPEKVLGTSQRKDFFGKFKLSNNLKPMKAYRSVNILRKCSVPGRKVVLPKRPFYCNKIDTMIDLVDSDTPMEEEHLVEYSSDDSDDEPLAKIAKKMRTNETEHAQASERHLNEEVSQTSSATASADLEACDIIDFEEAIDAIESPVPLRPPVVTEPVPTQLVLSGAALNQPIILNESFLASQDGDDEDSQHDCILGV